MSEKHLFTSLISRLLVRNNSGNVWNVFISNAQEEQVKQSENTNTTDGRNSYVILNKIKSEKNIIE